MVLTRGQLVYYSVQLGRMLSWDTAEVAEIGTCYFAASSQAAKNGDLKAVQE